MNLLEKILSEKNCQKKEFCQKKFVMDFVADFVLDKSMLIYTLLHTAVVFHATI